MLFVKSYGEAGCFMYVKQVFPSDNYTDLRVYSTEKDKNDPNKKVYSNWLVRCVGAAHKKAAAVVPGDVVVLHEFRLSNQGYVTDSGKYNNYLRIVAWDFDHQKDTGERYRTKQQESKGQASAKPAQNTYKKEDKKTYKKEPEPAPVSDPDEEMPF